jgi:hypothetical protein
VTDKAKPRTRRRRPKPAAQRFPPAAMPRFPRRSLALLRPIAELAVARGLSVRRGGGDVQDGVRRRGAPGAAGIGRQSHRQPRRHRHGTDAARGDPAGRRRRRCGGPPTVRPSPATQVFTRWRADPALRDRRGQPRALPRQGPAPSFETLARSVTQDVHPRSLLDELCRLGLAEVVDDEVRLLRESVVAGRDSERAFAFLGSNVGDHLRASVANVLAETPPHLEQAVFADELSAESIAAFRDIAKTQWQALLAATVPKLQALVDADASATGPRDRRVRIGLYTYHDAMSDPPAAPRPAAASPTPARSAAARRERIVDAHQPPRRPPPHVRCRCCSPACSPPAAAAASTAAAPASSRPRSPAGRSPASARSSSTPSTTTTRVPRSATAAAHCAAATTCALGMTIDVRGSRSSSTPTAGR